MPSTFIDSHCHLDCIDLSPWQNDMRRFISDLQEQHIEHVLCVSINWENFPHVLKLAQDHDIVSASIGVHPNERDGYDPSIEELAQKSMLTEIVAIGETGLDYFHSSGDMHWQHERFRRHIEVAKSAKKPLIIHTRESTDDTLAILRQENASDVGGVFHCFVDDLETAQKAIDLNFYISFSGIVTFKNADKIHEVARKIPLDRLLIETDSPYLAPVPYRGKPNQPAYVRHVAEKIAQLRDTSLDEICSRTSQNFHNLFTRQ